MTKEHAYAYEAGYRDGSTHYELEHCPACKNVADLQEALEENAKLRKLVCRLDEAIALAYMMHVPPTTADVLIAHEEEVDDG